MLKKEKKFKQITCLPTKNKFQYLSLTNIRMYLNLEKNIRQMKRLLLEINFFFFII